MNSAPVITQLSAASWREHKAVHRARAERYTLPARRRKDHGEKHPIEDFLFQYYPYAFAFLENWHAGVGYSLDLLPGSPESRGENLIDGGTESDFISPNAPPSTSCRIPTASPTLPAHWEGRHYVCEDGLLRLDPARMAEKERDRLRWIRDLLSATQDRTPNFACHGLHEWAMVYGGREVRHEKTTALRLPQAEIDAVVRSRPIGCSHHDAFRFFAPEARGFNRLQPSLDTRMWMEQPGCVHANMDLYKWAGKAMPWIGSELLLDCFEVALELRDLDMRASPYDLQPWGRPPVRIETPEGRREYEGEQKRLAAKAAPLRQRLIIAITAAIS